MAPRKKTPTKEPFLIRSHTLTPSTEEALRHLSQEASDALGWSVSHSAVVRALLRYVKQQSPTWAAMHLHPFIEEELTRGVIWGRRRKVSS